MRNDLVARNRRLALALLLLILAMSAVAFVWMVQYQNL
jgi:hypothetical protein